jgi:hypothetical protein
MRINFLAPHVNIAGGVRALLRYSDLFVARGHDVEIIIPAGSRLKAVAKQWRDWYRGEPRWEPTRARIRYVPSLTPRHLRPADATIATAWKTAYSLRDAGAGVGRRFYLVQHLESLYHGEPERVDATYRFGFETVTISHWLRDELARRFNVRSEVIVTPVDRGVFQPRPKQPGGAIRVCMMDHPSDWKDVRTGLTAIKRFREEGGECELVVFGATPNAIMEEFADEVHWGKGREELAEVYSSCDLYLCPSWFEGLGMPAMEAMMCGCTLVTTDTGGSRSYAIPGETALVADQRDPETLARHLFTLANDPALRQQLGDAGRNLVGTFDWDEAADRFLSLLAGRPSTTEPGPAVTSPTLSIPR